MSSASGAGSSGGRSPGRPARTPTMAEMSVGLGETEPYRAQRRPPLAYLCLQDNGPGEGEWLRLRQDRVVIGRTEGDVQLPFDPAISTRHAELTRQMYKGGWVWVLTDLQSTNGVFARVNKAPLEPGQELILGGGHYRFDSPLDRNTTPPPAAGDEDAEDLSTWRFTGRSAGRLAPFLMELTDQGEGQQMDLLPGDNLLGRDARHCRTALSDPMVDHRHCRIYREASGRWYIEDCKSLNGTWVRVEQFRIKQAAQFMLGEQRFLLRIGF